MSDSLSGRYQNALRYAPGRAAGVYLDGGITPEFNVQQVASRAPVRFDPFQGQVAQFGQVGLAQGQTQFTSDGSDAGAVGGGQNALALAVRYGPQALRAVQQARGLFGEEDAAINSFENSVAYTAPVAGPGVIDSFQNGSGIADSFVSGQGGAAAGALSGGADFAQGAVIDSFQNSVAPAAADAAVGGAGGASSLLSGLAGAGAGALGGYAGQYVGAMNNNGRVDGELGGQAGSAIGGAVGSLLGPVGTFAGAYFGGLLGSQLGPKPDFSTTYASARLGEDGQFSGGGEMRNGGSIGVGNDIFGISQNYFAQRAAAEGFAPNLAQTGNGYWFGSGQGEGGFGGFFLQPTGPDRPDIRPDNYALYTGGTEAYGGGGPNNAVYDDPRFRRPTDFGEALDAAYGRLVDFGFYTPQGTGPSQADVSGNLQAQRGDYFGAYGDAFAADPRTPEMGGPLQPNFAYNPDFQPGAAAASGLNAYGRQAGIDYGSTPFQTDTAGYQINPQATLD